MIKLEKDTLLNLTQNSFSKYAQSVFVTNIGDITMTYKQTEEKIILIQEIFERLGIKQGDRVAICSENMPNWGAVYLAITTIGAVAVPILPDFHTSEVHHILEHCEAKAIFLSKKQSRKLDDSDITFKSSMEYVFSIETFEILQYLANVPSELITKGSDALLQIKTKAIEFANTQTENKTLMQLKSKALQLANIRVEKEQIVINEDDLAAIIYTSGTTGQSKGVMLTHKNLISQLYQSKSFIEIHSDDQFLSILPLAHTFECTIGFLVPFANGASIHYINRVPSPKIILNAMEKVKPTCILSVPLVIEKIYKSKVQASFNKTTLIKFLYNNIPFIRKKLHIIAGKKLKNSFGGNIRFFGIGGAKLSPFVERFLHEAGFPYAIGYGLTETAPVLAGAVPGKTKVASTGLFADFIEHKFVKYGEDTCDGELHVRGPNIMAGYYKDPERTKEVLDPEGWLNTGDLGHVDSDGMLFINGRSKNVIISSSGENIYPEALESIINEDPMVLDSLVYEENNKVVAKIHIDYEKFDELHNIKNKSDSLLHIEILSLLEEIKLTANSKLAVFSKIMAVYEQTGSFVKTPTKKIKRYLYI